MTLLIGFATTACVTEADPPPRPSSDAGVVVSETLPLADDLPTDPGTDPPSDEPCLHLIDDDAACPD